jgi:integrase/recombinase XerD
MNPQIDSFLQFLADERGLSANTLSAYCNDLRQFEDHLASKRAGQANDDVDQGPSALRLVAASRAEVLDFFLQLREKGYSPATIARKMAAVKSVFHFLHRRGDIASNPALQLGSPEVKKPLPRAISVADVDTLILQAGKRSSPEGLRDSAMLHVLCATGMRVTELVSLDLGDVNQDEQAIVCTGRNGRRRELPIDDKAMVALRRYLREGRLLLLRPEHNTQALFLNHRGRRLTRQGFWLIMKAMARDSGIASEVTPHTLRHSFAAHRLKDGLELQRLRELLGHANISTTQIYTQVRFEPKRSRAETDSSPEPVGAGS